MTASEAVRGQGTVTVHPRTRPVADRFAIRAAWGMDGTDRAEVQDAVVIVDHDRVMAFGSAPEVGELGTMPVLAFPRHTVLPGLIDCHVHLMQAGDGRPLESIVEERDEQLLLRSARNASSHLAGGVTTVRDLGTRDHVAFDLRLAAAAGEVAAPRLLISGRPITPPGGHCHFFGGACDGPTEARRLARTLVNEGADVIKMMATGGLTRGTGHHAPGLSEEAMRAAVGEAHRSDVPTTVHASSIAGMWNALRAGIDCIEHAVFLDQTGTLTFDDTLAQAIAATGVFVCPTLQEAYRGLAPLEDRPEVLTPEARAQLLALRERKLGNIANTGRLHAAGVRLIAGSDAGSRVTPHGDLAFGVQLMFQAGLTIPQAVASATGLAAVACGIDRDVGTLAAGKRADLLVVKGDVHRDVGSLANTWMVFQGGRIAAERVFPASRVDP